MCQKGVNKMVVDVGKVVIHALKWFDCGTILIEVSSIDPKFLHFFHAVCDVSMTKVWFFSKKSSHRHKSGAIL